MASNVFAPRSPAEIYQESLGVRPKAVDPKAKLEAASARHGVPVNVLLAIAEADGDTDLANVEATARDLGEVIKGGGDLKKAIEFKAGDAAKARAIGARANQLLDILQPEAAPAPQAESGSVAGDLARQFGGTAVSGLGGAVDALGIAAEQGVGRTEKGEFRRFAERVGEGIRGAGEALTDSVSEAGKEALAGSTPGGELTDPSSWTMGEDPSVRGYAMQLAGVLGSMAPVVAASVLTRNPAVAAAAGGAMGGGAGADEARQSVLDMAGQIDADGKPALAGAPAYQKAISEGLDHDAAVQRTADEAARLAFNWTAPVSALGGAATQKIIAPVERRVSGSLAGAIAGRAGLSAAEEATQEVAEGVATRIGTNQATGAEGDLFEGSFGNAILGALGGGVVGGASGALDRREREPAPAPADEGLGIAPERLALPAPQRPTAADTPDVVVTPPPGPGPVAPLGIRSPERPLMIEGPREPASAEAAPGVIVPPAPERAVHPGFEKPYVGSGSAPMGSVAPGPVSQQAVGAAPIPAPSMGDPLGIMPAPAPMAPAAGPLTAAVQQLAPAPIVPPAPEPRFPDQKPGAAIRLAGPDGVVGEGVFMRETPEGEAVVRVDGQEHVLSPVDFDRSRTEATRLDEEAKAAAKAGTKTTPKPKPQAELPAPSVASEGTTNAEQPDPLRPYADPAGRGAAASPAETDNAPGTAGDSQGAESGAAVAGGGIAPAEPVAGNGTGDAQGLAGNADAGDLDVPVAPAWAAADAAAQGEAMKPRFKKITSGNDKGMVEATATEGAYAGMSAAGRDNADAEKELRAVIRSRIMQDGGPAPAANVRKTGSDAAPTIEPIRAKAAVLRGVPKETPPDVPGVSLKWDDKAGGFIFSRKHTDKVQAAVGTIENATQSNLEPLTVDETAPISDLVAEAPSQPEVEAPADPFEAAGMERGGDPAARVIRDDKGAWVIRQSGQGFKATRTHKPVGSVAIPTKTLGQFPDAAGALAAIREDGAPIRDSAPKAAPATASTAPEHAAVGVDDRELAEIVGEFNDAHASMQTGEEQIHHLFDAPTKGEVVRLAQKSRVYHKDHGWMTPAEAKARIAEWKEHARAQGGPGSVNADKVVLSLFDLTGSWSKPWEEAGYQVYRFDIQDDPEVGDVNNFSTEFFGDWFGDFDGQDIYAILAACPCTDFASSGARHFAAKDKDGRTVASVKLVHQTLATIEHFRPAVWAIENPVGRIEKLGGLPPWRLSFDPNDLGDPYTKKTLLWGRFNGDLPVAPVEPVEGSKMHSKYGGKSLATKNARSATPEGFAYGFFMANNAVDHPVMALANKFDRLDRKLIEDALAAGVTADAIEEAVADFYYMELDDDAANAAIRDLMPTDPAPRQPKARKAQPQAANPQPAAPKAQPAPSNIERTNNAPAPGILGVLSQDKQDRAAELKARLAAKARGQASSGLDPEYITLGGELVALYIEAGTKRFGQMLRDFAETTGLSMREAQAPMRAAYNHVRDDMDLNGEDVSDMDDAAAVMAEVRAALNGAESKPDQEAAPQQTQAETAPAGAIPAKIIKTDKAITARGREVPVDYALVELDDLIPSQRDDGRDNPAYPQELQPRDRSTNKSAEQVRKIAADLRPALLGESPQASNGAPIILPTGEVLSGNGRTLALRQAPAARMDEYRAFLKAQGYPEGDMRKPVLVRIVTENMTMTEAATFAREANERDTATMSASEQAMADAKTLRPSIIDLYRGGDVDAVGNREFVRAFLGSVVAPAEMGNLIRNDGSMTQDAVRRVQGALLARAYGDADLVGQVMEATDNNIKAIGGALMDVAARWSQMRDAAADNSIAPEMDATDALLEAVRIVDRARRAGRKVDEFIGQGDMFSGDSVSPMGKAFLSLMFRDAPRSYGSPRGREKLANGLQFYADEAMKTQPGADMLGDRADPQGTATTAKGKLDGSDGQQQQAGLFTPRNEGDGESNGSPVPAGAEPQRPAEPATAGGQDPQGNGDEQAEGGRLSRQEKALQWLREKAKHNPALDDVLTVTQEMADEDGIAPGQYQVKAFTFRGEIPSHMKAALRGMGDESSFERAEFIRYGTDRSTQNRVEYTRLERTPMEAQPATTSSDPQVNPTSPDTIRNWRKSVPSTGSVRGWTLFDDTAVGGSWVLLSSDLDARPFATESEARAWAQANPESGFDGEADAAPEQGQLTTEPGADGLPQTIMPGMEGSEDQRRAQMTQRQRLELEARQKQSKMRRLDGNSGDAGPLFDDQVDMFSAAPAPAPAAEGGLFDEGLPRASNPTEAVISDPDATDAQKLNAQRSKLTDLLTQEVNRVERLKWEAYSKTGRRSTSKASISKEAIGAQLGVRGDGSSTLDHLSGMVTLGIPMERKSNYYADVKQIVDAYLDQHPDNQSTAGAPPSQPTAEGPAKPAKIEDFGEKISGARKDVWASYADEMRNAAGVDVSSQPLSKSWPAPDYEKLIEAGVEPWKVSFIRAARDMIPTKPQKEWRLKGWVDAVTGMRELAQSVMDGEIDQDKLRHALFVRGGKSPGEILGQMKLYAAVGHAKSLKGMSFGQVSYSMLGGVRYDKPKAFWEVSQQAKATAFSNMPRTIARAENEADALEAFKRAYGGLDQQKAKAATARKWLVYAHEGRKYFTVGTKVGSTYIQLRRVDDVKEARRIIAEEADALQEQLDRLRQLPADRKAENAPRVGIDHRSGSDVTPEQFGETFGFRGVQFGNWVSGGRRQQDLNDAYDALMDMAGILDIPPRAISLNGTLGLAFGARGTGGVTPAAAHYEPGQVVINLTKMNGAGSLAHEWFHALDNYFAKARTDGKGGSYITDSIQSGVSVEGVRPEVMGAFAALRHAIGKTGLKARSGNIDKTRSKAYWSTGIELHARAFESYVIAKLQDNSLANDYLANVVEGTAWQMQAEMSGLGDSYPYLKPDEIEVVRPAFDALFETIQTRETEQGVELFRRDMDGTGEAITPVQARSINAAARSVMARVGLLDKIGLKVEAGRLTGATGSYSRGVVSILRNGAQGWRHTLDHEIVHALRDPARWGGTHGLFAAQEWRSLVAAARADAGIRARVEATYGDLDATGQSEEMVAELYADWAAGRREVDGGPLRQALETIRSFFRAMASALRGEGFVDAARIMERIASGEVGGRGPDGPGGQPRDAQGRFTAATEAAPKEQRDMGAIREALTAKARKSGVPFGFQGWRKASDFWSDVLTDGMGKHGAINSLALVPGRPLFTELGKNIKSAQAYLGLKTEMDAQRDAWHGRADAVAQKWAALARKDGKANQTLMDLMHKATVAQVDPSGPFMPRDVNASDADGIAAEVRRKNQHAALSARFNALPKALRETFVEVRDTYTALADDIDAALIENIKNAAEISVRRAERAHRKELRRIEDEGLEGAERDAAILAADGALDSARSRARTGSAARAASLRKAFESNRLSGPYFPLARFGNYFVTVKDADGKVISFSRFESKADQAAYVEDARKDNPAGKVEHGVLDASDLDLKSMVDPTFTSEIVAMLDGAGADPALLDAIWQRWLETLPDQSIRKSQIHRKGREGYHGDAFRAFGKTMFHGAHQLARLRFGLRMGDALDQAAEEAAQSDNPERAGFVVQEMKRRHAFAMNPRGNPLTSTLTGIGFIWYLGMSPAAAAVNLSQTTIMGPAIMAARFPASGVSGAVRHIGRASKDFLKGKGGAENSPRLTDDEKAAMQEAYRRGTVDRTQSHDLASVADSGAEYSATRERVMRKIGWLFHHTERANREVTFLASYRMARESGQGHQAAIDAAADVTWKTHFDYQNSSRPRIMQSDVAKVVLLFRSYSVNLLWRLFRDANQAFTGATKEERAEARTQLIGITLSMMAHAGIKGTWGFGIAMMLLGMFMPGDDDDAERWLQDALLMEGDDMGTAAWNWIAGAALVGIPGRALNVDLTNRIGSPNLWFRDSGRDLEGADAWNALVGDLLGPIAGLGASAFMAAGMVGEDPVRALEKIVPKAVRDPIKAGRYATDGVTTMNGDVLVEDLGPLELLAQASGLTPARVAERYEANNRMKNEEKRITKERQKLHKDLGDAVKSGKGISEGLLEQMRDFNRRYPEYPVTAETLRASMQSRARASERNEGGISLNPKLDRRLRENEATPIFG
ncbi:PLxRFG domain-containing protein [Paracoccus sp. 22332]|uniref:PLxRFG domain-containing protein n=1 Tax=Paracoccus sp. 22332 TaxID=3453913 RepID=UPI003F84B8D4